MNTFMQKLGVLAATLSAFLSASAYDFEVDGIFYNITNPSAKEVEVTYKEQYEPGYSGEIIVPASVAYDNELYTITTIGDEAFCYCNNLVSIVLPNSVTAIGNSSFSGCDCLTSITMSNSLFEIGDHAFYGCKGLISTTLPNSLTTIGEWVFCECSNLVSIILPNSVTTIGEGAFNDCSSLTSITLSNALTFIGEYAFSDCSSLTSITIPNSVTTIEEQTFLGCSSLTSIDVSVDNRSYSSTDGILYDKSQTRMIRCPGGKVGEVNIPNSVTTVGADAFAWCEKLVSVNIPNSVTTIEGEAFWKCSNLTSITIPNSVSAIGSDAFYECNNLISVIISNSVMTIEECAFYNCSNLTSITSLAVTPPECGESVFQGIDKQNCTLYVPAESIGAYKQAPEWKNFVHIEKVEAGIDSVEAGSVGTDEVFDLVGAKIADRTERLPAGIYIVRKGSTVRKIFVR